MNLIDITIEKWKNSLLDISKRNRAINYKNYKTSTIDIIYPDIISFLDEIESRPLKFNSVFKEVSESKQDGVLYLDFDNFSIIKKDEYTKDEMLNIIDSYNIIKGNTENVFSSYSLKDQTKKLRSIMNQSRLFEEENAINILYVSLGMIKWTNNKGEELSSPICFIPIKLNRKNIKDDFYVELLENEMIINESLSRLFNELFNIDLSFIFDSDLTLVDKYKIYKNHLKVILDTEKFEISDEINISVFKFNTINMVKDIEENEEKIKSHDLIKMLAGETNFKYNDDNTKLDNSLIKRRMPLDADYSQLDAIKKAKSGESFVLQGPPGTGKSQTITNIISELISDGKKVLFVAEKKAALDVVYNSFKKVGLEDYVLTLHNLNLNKKETISELADSLKNRQNNYEILSYETKEEIIDTYKESKDYLNTYKDYLINIKEPLNDNLYNLYNKYFSVRNNIDINFSIKDIFNINEEQLNLNEKLLNSLEHNLNDLNGSLNDNIWFGLNLKDDSFITIENIQKNLELVLSNLKEIKNSVGKFSEILDKSIGFISFNEIKDFISILNTYTDIKTNIDLFNNIGQINYENLDEEISLLKKLIDVNNKLNKVLSSLNNYDLNIIEDDLTNTLKLFEENNSRLKRLFNKEYKIKRKRIISYQKETNKNHFIIKESLKDLIGYKIIVDKYNKIIGQLNYDYSNLEDLENNINILKLYKQFSLIYNDIFNDNDSRTYLLKLLENELSEEVINDFIKLYDTTNNLLIKFSSTYNKINNYRRFTLNEFIDFTHDLINNKEYIKPIISINKLIDESVLYDILELVNYLISNNIKSNFYEIYLKRYYYVLINTYLEDQSFLKHLNKNVYDELRSKFKQSEERAIEASPLLIKEDCNKYVPNLNGFGMLNYEVNTLLRESNKKRRIKPIRVLFKEIPNLILNLKPCLMMSPLSVSTYLRNSDFEFDCVIFDEASQIHPENAIGAIYRSKQTIIVGDSKQLPPTNFFKTITDEDEEINEFSDVDSFESILDLSSSVLNEVSLKWHYRSKFEDLIYPSNNYIYKNLSTFPSSREPRINEGLEFNYVEGVYKDQMNIKEANYIVDLIFEHFKTFGNTRSLGVVTFNKKQTSLINNLILERREEDQRFESYFNYDLHEPFFVKNLENVQGDERDTIIISVTYGPDINNNIYMRFGPINHIGGERRLNVAVSRAKYNLKIVSSMRSNDIKLSETKNEGVLFLKEILRYAELESDNFNKQIETVSNNDVLNSIEESLKLVGYNTLRYFGKSQYKIELIVIDPLDPKNYLLAIELDGSLYSSSMNLSESERQKENILSIRGWNIYRVLSHNWFLNKELEINKIKKILELITKDELTKPKDELLISKTVLLNNKEKYEFAKYPKYDELLDETVGMNKLDAINYILNLTTPINMFELEKIIPPIYSGNLTISDKMELFKEDLNKTILKKNYYLSNNFVLNKNEEYKFKTVENYNDSREFKNIHYEELTNLIITVMNEAKVVLINDLYQVIRDLSGYQSFSQDNKIKVDNALERLKLQNIIDINNKTIKYNERSKV